MAPRSPLGIGEVFKQLAVSQPMALTLTVTNSAPISHTFDMTVDVKGGKSLPPYLNVNMDSTQNLLANWKCTPSEIQHPGTDNVFTCLGVVMAAGEVDPVMVTTGSKFQAAGDTISITATVTKDNGSTANLPAAVSATGTVA